MNVPEGTGLVSAAKAAGINISSPCGGYGTCGKCAVKILSGLQQEQNHPHLTRELKEEGYSLACQIKVNSDMIVEIPQFSRITKHQVVLGSTKNGLTDKKQLNPLCRKVFVKLEGPQLADVTNDFDRLRAAVIKETCISNIGISLKCLGTLPAKAREQDWALTVYYIVSGNGEAEIIHLESGRSDTPPHGLAIDIGTTTVAINLINTETGEVEDSAGAYNKQSAFGSDVISRIIHTDESAQGLDLMQAAVLDTVNELIHELLDRNGLKKNDIHAAICAGNTVMTHFLMKVPATWIRLEPYVPGAVNFPPVRAKELGFDINPDATIVTLPSVASYVGGDITAGVLSTGFTHSERLTLFIDVGTNGELVLGNKDWLVTCSCSAGPAFEGSGISCGMRAMDGAIDFIKIDPASHDVECRTIGNIKPLGICGSGLIYSLSEMMDAGIIDRAGKMLNTPEKRIRQGTSGLEYILAYPEETGNGREIVITEADVKNLLRAKGAVFAGIRTMLQQVQLDLSAIEKVYIAGGFGRYINIQDAINIGLLPDLPLDSFEYVGNSSIQGASIVLLRQEALHEAEQIGQGMTYLELSVGNIFMEEFISAVFIPHTDLSLFPSVSRKG